MEDPDGQRRIQHDDDDDDDDDYDDDDYDDDENDDYTYHKKSPMYKDLNGVSYYKEYQRPP